MTPITTRGTEQVPLGRPSAKAKIKKYYAASREIAPPPRRDREPKLEEGIIYFSVFEENSGCA